MGHESLHLSGQLPQVCVGQRLRPNVRYLLLELRDAEVQGPGLVNRRRELTPEFPDGNTNGGKHQDDTNPNDGQT